MNLSLDGGITFAIGAIMSALYIFSFFHKNNYLKEKFPQNPALGIVFAVSEKGRSFILQLLTRLYYRRGVSFLVLAAIIVATLSPVKALMEVEENVISKSCASLYDQRLLREGTSASECKYSAANEGISKNSLHFEETRSHFLQIALWPLATALYGWLLYIAVTFLRKNDEEPIDNAIEELPHLYHVLSILFIFLVCVVGLIQNGLGT